MRIGIIMLGVIHVDLTPEISLKVMSMSAGNKVELFDKMIELLQITPQRSW